MAFITGLALRSRPVAVLAIVLVLAAGVFAFVNLKRELFPEIGFPTIVITTVYPFADPETVSRDVTEPIEDAIIGINNLTEVRSTSLENRSVILANFEYGQDMDEAQRVIRSNVMGIRFPDGVEAPSVDQVGPDVFPVLYLGVTGDRDIPALQRVVDDLIIPEIERVKGVEETEVIGGIDERVFVTVDTAALEQLGLSLNQVSDAIRENNLSFPAGTIDNNVEAFGVRTTLELGALSDIKNLTIGFEPAVSRLGVAPRPPVAGRRLEREVLLSYVADVSVGTSDAANIVRTNGKPSVVIGVTKDADANTIDVTRKVLEALENIEGLPRDLEILTLADNGPAIQSQIASLQKEIFYGFLLAMAVVFVFLLNLRPGLVRGLSLTLRPTIVIAISIPLSVFTGALVMAMTGVTLNFMTLAGLAIAVGRVVDDSIVVLENMHRHIQRGESPAEAALTGVREVGAPIVASTLTTVAVFVPLAFIQGLVGSFFEPFARSVSYALVASTLVALTAVPVLGTVLMRRGDFPDQQDRGLDEGLGDAWMQSLYSRTLRLALAHRVATIVVALAITAASLGLMRVIPVTLFPEGTPDYLNIDVELPNGASVSRTLAQVARIEGELKKLEDAGLVEVYQVTIGGEANQFGPSEGNGRMNRAGFFVRLAGDAPGDVEERVRSAVVDPGDGSVTVTAIHDGPPAEGLEVTITGSNFSAIKEVAGRLEANLGSIDGIINLTNDVSEAKNEVVINVDSKKAAEFGLTTAMIGQQVNRFLVGQKVSEIDLEGVTMDIVVRGVPEETDNIDKLRALTIEGPLGTTRLGFIGGVTIMPGPVSVSRLDGERSGAITGSIVAKDTQAIGRQVQASIDALDVPPGIHVSSGGVFTQINDGFQDVFLAIMVAVPLVYLVMVASLGGVRNPLIIVISLPLAVAGALIALAITGRSLSLSALMGFLLLVGVVVTNAIVLITFVEQLRQQGYSVYDALVAGGLSRLRPILMTACTTIIALVPLALSSGGDGGVIGAELATVVIGGMFSSTALTLVVVPVVYTIMHESLPRLAASLGDRLTLRSLPTATFPGGASGED